MRWRDRQDAALLVERQTVDAYLAMGAGNTAAELAVYIVLIDAVIDNIPLVATRNLEHGVVGGSIDLVLGLLTDDKVALLVDADGPQRRLGGAVADMVIGGTRVVD